MSYVSTRLAKASLLTRGLRPAVVIKATSDDNINLK